MASVDSVNFQEISFSNLRKIENFLSDAAYKEVIENSETFNTRLCIERRLRMPFLDPQTGVAQYHSTLFMEAKQRIPGLKEGQIYSYPALRWRKSRRQYLLQKPQPPFPAYTHRPFGHLQSIYDSENSNLESNVTSVEQEVITHKEDPGKDWYYDEMDMHDGEPYEDHDLLDSDCDFEESYNNRKKRIKNSKITSSSSKAKTATVDTNSPRRGRGGTGRGRGRKPQCALDSPSGSKELSENNHKKQRPQQALPHLVPQLNPVAPVPLEEPAMPILIPEMKMTDEVDEKIQMKSGLLGTPSTTVGSTSSPTPSEPAVEKSRAIPSPYCDFCLGDARENKKTLEPEELVSCSDCGRSGHPSCLQFTANMIISVRKYRWQCIECKYCTICGTSDNDDQLLFCDDCDRGYHMYCLLPPLISPPEGSWSCKLCTAEFHSK